MITTSVGTTVLILLALKATGWPGAIGAFLLQGVLALGLLFLLVVSNAIGA